MPHPQQVMGKRTSQGRSRAASRESSGRVVAFKQYGLLSRTNRVLIAFMIRSMYMKDSAGCSVAGSLTTVNVPSLPTLPALLVCMALA